MNRHFTLLKSRFQIAPKKEHATDIYNYLTGNDGTDVEGIYDEVVLTAVWNMEPYNFVAEGSKHNDYWYRSRNNAPQHVANYMDAYYKKAKKNDIELYSRETQINDKGLPW